MTIRIHFHRQDCLGEPFYKDHDTIVTHIEDAVQFAQNVLDNFNSMCFNGHELRILYVECFAIDEAACRIADAIKDNRGSGAEESNR